MTFIWSFNNTYSFSVRCSSGTFQNVTTGKCEDCPAGTFQPEEGQTSCLKCPGGSIIVGGDNKNFTSCKSETSFKLKS